MQYTKPLDDTASEMFIDAHEYGYGGAFAECRCGISHYATRFYEDEIEDEDELRDRLPPESEHVKHHDADAVLHFELDGRHYVSECEGCRKTLARYEQFIWDNRQHIRNYLKIRIDQEKAWADQENICNILAGISQKTT